MTSRSSGHSVVSGPPQAIGTPPIRVLSVQQTRKDDNPYIALLHRALEARGVEFVTLPRLDSRRIERAAARADVLHLHWLEQLTASRGNALGRLARGHVRLLRTVQAIRRARAAGLRIVWTVHNLRPHERGVPWIDRILTREVLRSAEALLVHSDYAADRVGEVLRPRCPVWIAPHGNYLDVYGRARVPQRKARTQLGLPESGRLLLCFGQVRAYKRIPEVVRAFRRLPDADARLVVAGRPHPATEAAAIAESAAEDPRVHLRLETVPTERVGLYHAAADVAVLNYREVFSSGALLLALSQGLPVVAPAGGASGELVDDATGFPFEDGELAGALARALTAPLDGRSAAALRASERCTWDRAAEQTTNAYRGVAPSRPRARPRGVRRRRADSGPAGGPLN